MILLNPKDLLELARDKSLVFELGFGNGDFLLYLTESCPDAVIVGAEVANHYFLVAFRKLLRANRSNFLLYRGDGRTLLNFFVENHSISSIYINFPDPWEKPSKEGKRLVSLEALKIYYSRLRKGGTLFVATDSETLKDYLRQSLSSLNISFQEEDKPPYGPVYTKYAKKWLSLNKPVGYFIITKTDERVFKDREFFLKEMPNFIFSIKGFDEETIQGLKGMLPLEHREEGCFSKIDKIYRGEGEYLFRVISSEPFLNQKYYLVLKVERDRASLEIDDRNSIIISKFVFKTFSNFAKVCFELFGKDVIFSNLGSGFRV